MNLSLSTKTVSRFLALLLIMGVIQLVPFGCYVNIGIIVCAVYVLANWISWQDEDQEDD